MERVFHRAVGIALLVLAFGFAAPGGASAREFTGKVDSIQKGEKGKLIVDNRKGDKLQFNRVPETVVEGEKAAWDDISQADWVSVEWQMMDKPRKAYRVIVLPPREGE